MRRICILAVACAIIGILGISGIWGLDLNKPAFLGVFGRTPWSLRSKFIRVFVGSWVGGGVVGALLAYLVDGSMRFFGVGLPLGL